MGYSNTVFRQMLSMIPQRHFADAVAATGADRYTKHFTAWNQFIVNLYAQASGKKSLRDIEAGLRVQQGSWYHLGLKNISRSQLSYVNGRRDYSLFQGLFNRMLVRCADVAPKHKFKYPLKILDSTLVHLCLSPDSILVADKAYIDFEWLSDLNFRRITFVTRAKVNMNVEVLRQQPTSKDPHIIADQEVLLKWSSTFKKYPNRLRLVTWHDDEHDKTYTFMTNNFALSAKTILLTC